MPFGVMHLSDLEGGRWVNLEEAGSREEGPVIPQVRGSEGLS